MMRLTVTTPDGRKLSGTYGLVELMDRLSALREHPQVVWEITDATPRKEIL